MMHSIDGCPHAAKSHPTVMRQSGFWQRVWNCPLLFCAFSRKSGLTPIEIGARPLNVFLDSFISLSIVHDPV